MRRIGMFALACLGGIAVGCNGEKKTSGQAGAAKPTEQDVVAAVKEMVVRNNEYYRAPNPEVTLLSPLIEPSEQFFQKNSSYDRTALACYVWIASAEAGKDPKGGFRQLVVVVRDSGRLKVPVQISDVPLIKETFGEEWLTAHPMPEKPK